MQWARRQFRLSTLIQCLLLLLAVLAGWQLGARHSLLPAPLLASRDFSDLGADISLAYLGSWIFNLLVVAGPRLLRRRQLRRWLEQSYFEYKRHLITIFLGRLNVSWEYDFPDKLLDADNFVEFFDSRYDNTSNYWHQVHNGLYEGGLDEIRRACQIFISNCNIAISLVGDPSIEFINRYRSLQRVCHFQKLQTHHMMTSS